MIVLMGDTMDRRSACLAQAARCLEKAQTDTERREYWLAEAKKWTARADEYEQPTGKPAGA
jgi:hypothetical protein